MRYVWAVLAAATTGLQGMKEHGGRRQGGQSPRKQGSGTHIGGGGLGDGGGGGGLDGRGGGGGMQGQGSQITPHLGSMEKPGSHLKWQHTAGGGGEGDGGLGLWQAREASGFLLHRLSRGLITAGLSPAVGLDSAGGLGGKGVKGAVRG